MDWRSAQGVFPGERLLQTLAALLGIRLLKLWMNDLNVRHLVFLQSETKSNYVLL